MSETPQKQEREPETTLAKFRWPLVVVAVFLIGALALLAGLKGCGAGGRQAINAGGTQAVNVIRAMGEQTSEVMAKFTQGTITRTFQEALPTMSREKGGRLELGSLTATETFSKTDNLTTAWGWLDLGSTVSEIRVPATYRYYLRLHDPWKLDVVTSNICIVYAPAIHASLPPAINTAGMEKKSESGWGRFNADQQMAELESDITPTLARYAMDPRHVAGVREECRKTVAEFVRDWLLREHQWQDDRFTSIKVLFADEKIPEFRDLPPTIQLEIKSGAAQK